MHVSTKLFETIMFAIQVRNAYEIRVVCHFHQVCRSTKTLSVDWKKMCTVVDTWRVQMLFIDGCRYSILI